MNVNATLLGDDAELFRLHYHRLVRQVQRDAGVPEAVAEDCASFAILQLHRRKPGSREVTPGWLRVVARHEAYAWHSDNKRFPRVRDNRQDRSRPERRVEHVSAAELIESPVDVELAFQAREALRALAGLGNRRRAALTLKVAGYSYAEIQQLLGVTYTWVNRHVTEARAKLRHDAQLADETVDRRARCRDRDQYRAPEVAAAMCQLAIRDRDGRRRRFVQEDARLSRDPLALG